MDIDSVLQNIRELLPSIRARRQEIDEARCLPRDLAEELSKTGIFRLGVPRSMGGLEAKPADIMRAIEMVSTADGSAGWCAMIGISGNLVAGYMNEPGAREVFADPVTPTAGIAAPSGAAVRSDHGVRVNGRWSYASGITHCKWTWAGCLVMENGKPRMTPHGPEIIHVCIPVSELSVHDTWHVSGLRGTGSNDFSAADIFVPEARIFGLLDPSGHRPEPLYQMPAVTLFVVKVAAVALGVARSALDELAQLAREKVPTFYTQTLAERAMAQVDLARAEASLGGARSFLYAIVDEVWQAVSAGRMPAKRELALVRSACTQAVETAAAVSRTANTLAGGASIYNASSIQRHARDAEAITHHFTVAPHTWEEAGRALLGLEANVPVF